MGIIGFLATSLIGLFCSGLVLGLLGEFAFIATNVVLTGTTSVPMMNIVMGIAGATVMGVICEWVSSMRGCEKGWFKWGFSFGVIGILIVLIFGKKVTDSKRKVLTYKSVISYAIHAILVAFMVVVFYPFLVGFFYSFKTSGEILTGTALLPEQWNFSNYITAWTEANFARYTFNSAWYTAATICVTVLTSTVNGYAFARGEFRGKSLIFATFSALMFITLGSSSLYPSMQLMKMFHLNTSLWGLVIKGFFAIHITDMYLVRGFINQLPRELDEAATIDGCGFIGIFFRIILPLLKPMVATLAILTFSGAWNDYLWPMIVTMSNEAAQPLSVALRALNASGDGGAANWHIIMAASMISALPMMVVYLIFNKYFVKGLAAGAVKG